MAGMNELVEDLFQTLISSNDPIHGLRPMPCEFDAEISNLVNVFAQGSSADREEILGSIRPEYSDAFFAFAERMAALGVRENSRQRLFQGLLALIIEGYKSDWRDSLRVLAPLYHSATKIGIDPSALFLEAASHSSNEASKAIAKFPKRAPEDRTLKAMWYKEEDGPEGFRYVSMLVEPL